MLDPGGKGRLDLGEVGPGTYRIRCDVLATKPLA
jgi:hypothetical protein